MKDFTDAQLLTELEDRGVIYCDRCKEALARAKETHPSHYIPRLRLVRKYEDS